MYNIHMLPASYGDCLLIEYGDEESPTYILIDGGPYYQFEEIYSTLQREVPKMKEIELLVITHVDTDHIEGVIRLIRSDPSLYDVKKVWFNSFEDLNYEEDDDMLGGLQGEFLNLLVDHEDLDKNTKPITINRSMDELVLDGGMEIVVVNPSQKRLKGLAKKWEKHVDKYGLDTTDEAAIWEMLNGDHRYEEIEDDMLGEDEVEDWAGITFKEDKSAANRSSIAFLASYEDKTCLFAADATSEDLKTHLEALELLDEFAQLQVDAWKLSHHGSKKSTQAYLTKMIQSTKVLVSSDGKRYHHPDKETIAKLLLNQEADLDIYFNYKSDYNEMWESDEKQEDHAYKAHFPEHPGYMKVVL